MKISRQTDSIWSQSAAGRGHQHRPAYDTPHSTYKTDRSARELGEALGAKHRLESEHADQPRDKHGRFLPMPHHEKEKKDTADHVRRNGGDDLEDEFHAGYEHGHKHPHAHKEREEARERHEKRKSEQGTHHHQSHRLAAPRRKTTPEPSDEEDDLGGDGFSDVKAPWETALPEVDPEEEEAWSRNPARVPPAPRITERVLAQDPHILERHEIANARGLRPKGLHLSQPKGMTGHLMSEPQHYFNDDGSHNFSVVHHVIDPAHSKSGMWEVNRWKYSSNPAVGGSVDVSHHVVNEHSVGDVVGQLESNYDWDQHEGIGGQRLNKEWEERYQHDHPANGMMLDPIQYEIRYINAHRINRNGDHEYYFDPDATGSRWMPHPNDPKKQFQGANWLVTTKLWQRDHKFDPKSDGRYVVVDHKLFHPDDAHGALRYVYADQHGGSLAPREGSIFSHLFVSRV